MSKGTHNIFVVVVNFISNGWEPKHVIVVLFEVINTSHMAVVFKLQKLLNKFTLTNKIIVYVKDEGSNL
jgi:hypothetical protein